MIKKQRKLKQTKEQKSTTEASEIELELLSVGELKHMVNEIPGCSESDVADMEVLLHCAKNDRGLKSQRVL